jgi:hypothetical protein
MDHTGGRRRRKCRRGRTTNSSGSSLSGGEGGGAQMVVVEGDPRGRRRWHGELARPASMASSSNSNSMLEE